MILSKLSGPDGAGPLVYSTSILSTSGAAGFDATGVSTLFRNYKLVSRRRDDYIKTRGRWFTFIS